MTQYKNFGGNSGVKSFRMGRDNIVIQFRAKVRYLYTYLSAGAANVEKMKDLAIQGEGLNTFVNRVVKKSYARKF